MNQHEIWRVGGSPDDSFSTNSGLKFLFILWKLSISSEWIYTFCTVHSSQMMNPGDSWCSLNFSSSVTTESKLKNFFCHQTNDDPLGFSSTLCLVTNSIHQHWHWRHNMQQLSASVCKHNIQIWPFLPGWNRLGEQRWSSEVESEWREEAV